MATMVPPQKGVEYIFYITLVSQADIKLMQDDPTIATGDATVTTDGNAVTNLDTDPVVDPASSHFVKVTVSSSEMNGDNIIILFQDAADDEWCDRSILIQTSGQSLDAMDTNIDDIETDVTAIHGTDLPAVKADTVQIRYGDTIYFEEGGAAGEDYPIGTPTDPSGVIADVIGICTTTNIQKIHVHGALTIGDTMEHYSFFGERHETISDTVNLNGQDVDGSYFDGLTITGTQGGTAFINIKDCVVYALVNIRGMITNSAFYTSTFQLPDASFADWDSCYSISGAVTLTVQAPTRASIKDWHGNLILTAQDGGIMLVRGFTGTLEIDLMTSGTLDVYAESADITINADCNGGTINLYGAGKLTNNTGGAIVNNYLFDAAEALPELEVGIPTATPTYKAALMLPYMMIRNKKTVTEDELGVFNDAGTKIHLKDLADDGTTYTEDEMISGA